MSKRLTLADIEKQAQAMSWQIHHLEDYYQIAPLDDDWSYIPNNIVQELQQKKFRYPKELSGYLNFIQDNTPLWKSYRAAVLKHAQLCIAELEQLYPNQVHDSRIDLFAQAVAQTARTIIYQTKLSQAKAEQELYETKMLNWATSQNWLTKKQIMQQLGFMHECQFFAAIKLDFIVQILISDFPKDCLPPRLSVYHKSNYYKITDNLNHLEINDAALLTRIQAAEFLQITPKEFDKLKKDKNLPVAKKEPGRNFHTYYLYKFSDILNLRTWD